MTTETQIIKAGEILKEGDFFVEHDQSLTPLHPVLYGDRVNQRWSELTPEGRYRRPLPAPQRAEGAGCGPRGECVTVGSVEIDRDTGAVLEPFDDSSIPEPPCDPPEPPTPPIALPVRLCEFEKTWLVDASGLLLCWGNPEQLKAIAHCLNSPRSETEGRDKERLDWLEHVTNYSSSGRYGYIMVPNGKPGEVVNLRICANSKVNTLRAAIDAVTPTTLAHEPEAGE